MAIAQTVQHTLVMVVCTVTTVVNQAKKQISHLTDLAAGYSVQ